MPYAVADIIAAHEPKDFDPFPFISETNTGSKPRFTLVVACMDPRCSIDRFIDMSVGSKAGDMVMISRNAGGNIRFALRDILLFDTRFMLDELVIVHHTDCGSLQVTDEGLREGVKARVDRSHWAEVDKIEWGANTDMVASVKADLEWLYANPLVRNEIKRTARGFLFDIKTGKAEEIKLA